MSITEIPDPTFSEGLLGNGIAIKAAGLNTITPVLICNTDDYTTFNTTIGKAVTNANVVMELGK